MGWGENLYLVPTNRGKKGLDFVWLWDGGVADRWPVRRGMSGSVGSTLVFTEHERAFCPKCSSGEARAQGSVW